METNIAEQKISKLVPLPNYNFVTVSEDTFALMFKMANRLETIVGLYQDREKSFMTDVVIQNVIDEGLVEDWKRSFEGNERRN